MIQDKKFQALDTIIKKEWEKTESKRQPISELARDGTRITQTIIAMGGYKSISGHYIRIDSKGDSVGSFTAFALKPYNYRKMSKFTNANFTCGHYLLSVGEFHWDNYKRSSGLNGKELPEYSSTKGIDWHNKFPPLDEPVCGFHGERCHTSKAESITRFIIAAGILGGLLMILLILMLSFYRKWKIEQEIEGLLWKINPQSLQRLYPRGSIQSLGSLNSGSK